MLAKDMELLWKFDKPLTQLSLVQCPECIDLSKVEDWEEGFVDCETCGDHDALVCPLCGESHDHVWVKEFKVFEVGEEW